MITPITPGYRQEQNRNQKHVLHYIPNLYSFPSNIMVLWYATKKDSFHKPPPQVALQWYNFCYPKKHCKKRKNKGVLHSK